MSIRIGWLAAASLLVMFAGTVQAQINGLHINERVFNDFSTTTLVPTNTNSVNQGFLGSAASFEETLYTDDGMGGNFANRHDVVLSRDNGASEHVFSADDSWTFSAIVTLDAGTDVPQVKEGGMRINSPITSDALFLVKTNGEIAAFGGGAPFFSFSAGMGVLNDYVPGTQILLGMRMVAFGDGPGPGDNLIEYFIDRAPGLAGGEESSGLLPFDNIEGAPLSYHLALYGQAPPNLANPADFLLASFNDIKFVPEPGTALMTVLGALAVGFIRRRRGQ